MFVKENPGRKKTHQRVDKFNDKTINKVYAEYKQRELNEKGKNRKALDKHVITLYSSGIFQVAKIKNVKRLQQDIENYPIIRDQMTNLGCLLVCSFGNYLRLF